MSEPAPHDTGLPDPSTLVEHAIESVRGQVPGAPDFSIPETGTHIQPWADVAAPPGKNKRPLEDLLDEYAKRVAEAPDARAAHPNGQRAADAFFARLASVVSKPGRAKRRRRRKPSGTGAAIPAMSPSPAGHQATQVPHGGAVGSNASGPKRRRRRGRGRRGRGSGSGVVPPPAT